MLIRSESQVTVIFFLIFFFADPQTLRVSAAKAVVVHVGNWEKKASDVAVFGFCKESEAK